MTVQGFFISFEGPDGAGKTSVMTAVAATLAERWGDQRIMQTREPGGNHIAEQIRAVLFDDANRQMDARTEALLFAAARRQHVVEDLKPALAAGQIILSDRYVDSSVAYQGAGRGLGMAQIWELNQYAVENCMPQLTIYLDLPVRVGLARIAQHRADQVNRLDEEALSFHETVHAAFDQLAAQHPARIVKVDANQPQAAVVAAALAVIKARLGL